MATDLWPEFKIEASRGIRHMLEDAGRGLREKTNGVVEFRVRQRADIKGFKYFCDLFVPNADFAYPILYVVTGISSFPAQVFGQMGDPAGEVLSEDDLRRVLAGIFQSDEVKEAVVNLVQNFGTGSS